MEERHTSLKEYFSIVKRRRWHMVLTFLVIMVLSALLAFGLPATYRSTAVIAIEEQEIPEELVRSTITSFADERIQRITQKALTSLNLSRLIDEHNLYADQRERLPRSEIIDEMREDLHMELVSADVIDPRSGRPSKATIAFTLAFDYASPTVAQKVTNSLVTLVQGTNLDDRIAQTEGTSEFLTGLVNQYNAEVLEYENQLAQFKGENEGALPDMVNVNLELMQRFERDMLATENQLQSLRNQIIFLEAQLLQIDPYLQGPGNANAVADPAQAVELLKNELTMLRSQYASNHPDIRKIERMIAEYEGEVGLSGQFSVAQIEDQLVSARAELDSARGSYGAAHPEIGRLERLVSLLESDIERARSAGSLVSPSASVVSEINVRAGPGTDAEVVGVLSKGETATLVDGSNREWYKIALNNGVSGFVAKAVSQAESRNAPAADTVQDGPPATNPAYIQTRATLVRARSEAESLIGRYSSLQQKIAEYELRISRAPLVEREYSALTRNLNDARMRLGDAKVKADQARTAVDIERNQKAQQFTLLEPPIAPVTPHSPNRLALLTLGFVLSLFGTLAAAAIAESLDSAIRSSREIFEIVGAAPLASIPLITNPGDSRRSRRGAVYVIGAVLLGLLIVALLIHFLIKPLDVAWYQLLRKVGV